MFCNGWNVTYWTICQYFYIILDRFVTKKHSLSITIENETMIISMKKTIIILCLLLGLASVCQAQDTMRIHFKGGGYSDVAIGQVESITFVDGGDAPTTEASLIGGWLWGSQEQGYYEMLTINDDHTYTGYDNYFSYGFDTMTYGWWAQIGAMITLQSNGFGYQRRYNWYITELSENALGVMTKMGPFTYYRLQPETLHLPVNGTLTCEGDDCFVFADGVTATIQDNKLTGLTAGTTYVQKRIAISNSILSYKVIVE